MLTSGDYERYYDPDKKFHHIVNPLTGYSATELISVTIVGPAAFDADALATSVFVLGLEKGMKTDRVPEGLRRAADHPRPPHPPHRRFRPLRAAIEPQ